MYGHVTSYHCSCLRPDVPARGRSERVAVFVPGKNPYTLRFGHKRSGYLWRGLVKQGTEDSGWSTKSFSTRLVVEPPE
jgi:hypothetical protein